MRINMLPRNRSQEELVRRRFEATSDDYHELYSGAGQGGQDVILRYLKFLSPMLIGKRVLDVACGPGYLCNEALSRGARCVVGVDFSWSMVRIAREQYPHLYFVLGDAKHLPFADGAFDVTFSFRSLQHIPKCEAVLREMEGVTACPGRVIFDFINRWNPLGCLRDMLTDLCGAVYLRAHSHRVIEKMCEQAGLSLQRYQPIQLFADATNAQKYLGCTLGRWAIRVARFFESRLDSSRVLRRLALRIMVVCRKDRPEAFQDVLG